MKEITLLRGALALLKWNKCVIRHVKKEKGFQGNKLSPSFVRVYA
jgi:hypothetical protein